MEKKTYKYDAGDMNKMTAMSIYGKTLQKLSSPELAGRFPRILVWKHWGLQLIIVCSNDDPGVTLTYFTARSNFEA